MEITLIDILTIKAIQLNRVNVRKLRLSMVIEKANETEDVLCSRAQEVLKALDKSVVDKCWFRNNQGKLKQSTKS